MSASAQRSEIEAESCKAEHAKRRSTEVLRRGPVGKAKRAFPIREFQSAARTNRPPEPNDLHTDGLSGIFSDVHAAGENDLN